MNIYTCNSFSGQYPVGTSAVIVAESVDDAKKRLENELKRIGLEQKINPEQIKVVETDLPDVIILNDGNY